MINAKELKIGNYVLGDTGLFLEVTGVGIKNYSEAEPSWNGIPFTEEWLNRFGFKYLEDFMSYVIGRPKKESYWHFDLELFSSDHCFFFSWKEIEYVHQLQNLYFALTGEELKLKEAAV